MLSLKLISDICYCMYLLFLEHIIYYTVIASALDNEHVSKTTNNDYNNNNNIVRF